MGTNRRRFLALLGTVPIAGCSSGGDASPETQTPTDTATVTPTNTPTETPTETATDTTTPEPASFEVVEYDVPKQVEIGEEFTIAISVKNTGGKAGKFSAPIYLKTADSSWVEQSTWNYKTIQPGEVVTLESSTISFDYINRYSIRLGNTDKVAVIQTVSAKLSWGSEYKTPEGYRIQISKPTLQPTYEYKDWQGNIVEKEPEGGGQWAFVDVWVKNETGKAAYSPLSGEFALVSRNSQYDSQLLFDDPINKGEQFDGGELQPGIVRSGWIVYAIPDGLGVSDMKIAWSQSTFNGELSVNWLTQG